MYWTLALAQHLKTAPFPATRDELIDYALRSGAPLEVLENLHELPDDNSLTYEFEDLLTEYPGKEDVLVNQDF